MDEITREQYKTLRRQGYSVENIQDFARRGRVDEKLDNRTFQQKGLFRAAGDFLNMDEFGRGIAMAGRNITGATQRQQESILQQQQQQSDSLISAVRDARERGDQRAVDNLTKELERVSQQDGVDFKTLADGGVSNREVLGSAASTALNVASLGGAFSWGGKAISGANSLGQAARIGATQGAIGGAAFGAAEATTEGTGALPGAAQGAALGAVAGGVLGGVSKYVDDLTKVTPESRLHETKDAFKTLQRKFKEGAVYKNVDGKRALVSNPITTITDEGVGSQLSVVDGKIRTEDARTLLRELIDEQKDKVSSAIAQSTQNQINTSLMSLKQAALERVRSNDDLVARGVVNKTVNQIDNIFDDYITTYGDDLTTANVNSIREGMNRVFNADTIDAERAIGDAARRYVYQNAPGSQQALAREGQLIAADKFLDALDGRAVKGGRLGGYFGNLIGAIAGQNATDTYLGSVAGALTGGKITQLIQQQQINPILPRTARGISSIVEQLPADAAGNISRTAVLNLIGQLSAQQSSEETGLPEEERNTQ